MPAYTLFQLRTLDMLIAGDVATAQPVNFESAEAAFNAHFLPVPLDCPLHCSRHRNRFAPGETKTHNVAQSVLDGRPAATAADTYGEIPLRSDLGKRDYVVAGGQSPAAAIPQKAVVAQMVVVVVAKNIKDHSAPEFFGILGRCGSKTPQLIGQSTVALPRRLALMCAKDR